MSSAGSLSFKIKNIQCETKKDSEIEKREWRTQTLSTEYDPFEEFLKTMNLKCEQYGKGV